MLSLALVLMRFRFHLAMAGRSLVASLTEGTSRCTRQQLQNCKKGIDAPDKNPALRARGFWCTQNYSSFRGRGKMKKDEKMHRHQWPMCNTVVRNNGLSLKSKTYTAILQNCSIGFIGCGELLEVDVVVARSVSAAARVIKNYAPPGEGSARKSGRASGGRPPLYTGHPPLKKVRREAREAAGALELCCDGADQLRGGA